VKRDRATQARENIGMSNPRIDVHQLQRRDPRVWTNLLCTRLQSPSVIVEAVQSQTISPALTRYTLQLEGYSDPITLIGKQSNAREVHFYDQLSAQLSFLAPSCWFSHWQEDAGWLVLDDIPNDRLPAEWTLDAIEDVVAELAFFHALFWEQAPYLSRFDWLPSAVDKRTPSVGNKWFGRLADRAADDPLRNSLLSEHAIQSSGALAPLLAEAAAGLQALMALGGWPDVIEEKHMEALASLLDDPLPMLQPLREQPQTLLHGFPGIYNWRCTLFDDCRLLDWRKVSTGPALLDLIVLVETAGLLQKPSGDWSLRQEWVEAEEHIIDSYMMHMSQDMGRTFDARGTRQALPAARCLHVLTHWLPRFNAWFQRLPNQERTWQLNQLSDEQLAQTLYAPTDGLDHYLSVVFQRFLQAYHQLS
jgi:hypothetical protein